MKKLRIIFAGTPEFAVPTLQALIDSPHHILAVFTQPDRPAGRGRKQLESPIKQLALQHHLTVKQPENLKSQHIQQEIIDYKADLMIVVAYGQLLPQAVLNAPHFGCINVHASLLPRWRGAAPIHHAILAGDKETGVCIMQMDVGLDTGPVYSQSAIPIMATDTTKNLHDKLSTLGAKLLIDTLPKIINPDRQAIPQDSTHTTYAGKINKEQAKIDWNQSAKSIDRLIRAFNPWPVAYTQIHTEIIRVWEAEVINQQIDEKPGTIINLDKNGIEVATGEGIIRLHKIQFASGKILTVAEILNARKEFFQQHKFFSS
jgi:methionyl-tRNA formyltransferase